MKIEERTYTFTPGRSPGHADWPAAEQETWRAMQQAGDRRDWPEFRRLQARLVEMQEARQGIAGPRHSSREALHAATGASGKPPAAAASRAVVDDQAAPVGPRTVEAYALTWSALSRGEVGGRPCWLRVGPDALADWLTEHRDAPVVVNHGWQVGDDDRQASPLFGAPVGRFASLAVDDYGLRTVAQYDATPEGDLALSGLRSGALVGYSCHLSVLEAEDTGEQVDGLPVMVATRAVLHEAGPTDDPADVGAYVLTIGGQPAVRSALAVFEQVTGRSAADVAQDIADEQRAREQAARDQVRTAEGLASALKKARRAASVAYGMWRTYRKAADFDEYREADNAADRIDARLSEVLCHDAALYQQMVTTWQIPAKVSLTDRMRAA